MLPFLLSPLLGAILGIYLKRAYPRIIKILAILYLFIFGAMMFGAILSARYPGPESSYLVNSWSWSVREYVIQPTQFLWATLPFLTALAVAYFDAPLASNFRSILPTMARLLLTPILCSLLAMPIAAIGGLYHSCHYAGACL